MAHEQGRKAAGRKTQFSQFSHDAYLEMVGASFGSLHFFIGAGGQGEGFKHIPAAIIGLQPRILTCPSACRHTFKLCIKQQLCMCWHVHVHGIPKRARGALVP